MKLVYVQWMDSCGLNNGVWKSRDDAEEMEPLVIDSVGYVLKETEEHITIASHVCEHQVSGEMSIPKSAIIGKPKALK